VKPLRSLLPALLLSAALPAQAAVKVVATTEGLASLAREVGGSRVQVVALSKGIQDPHFVDARPSLVVSLRDATLLVDIGADLEIGWLPPLVTQARNASILPGGVGRLSAASAVRLLDLPTGPVDRSQGDLHPGGNPHFLSDPHRGLTVARAIADRLKQLDAAGAAEYDAAYAVFEKKAQEAQKKWSRCSRC
jgi:zinc/manganese transport system substrate-binding protein